jgi:hypothetical protein
MAGPLVFIGIAAQLPNLGRQAAAFAAHPQILHATAGHFLGAAGKLIFATALAFDIFING